MIVKPDALQKAIVLFEGTGIKITTGGNRDLGAAIGSNEFINTFLKKKIDSWISEVSNLAKIAHTQPQAALAVFTHGLRNKWAFIQRTMGNLSSVMRVRVFFPC